MKSWFRILGACGGICLLASYAGATYSGLGGQAYTHVFRGTADASWSTLENWCTTDDGGTTWTQETGKIPMIPSSNLWEAALLDGDLMETIQVSGSYKAISAPTLEGWAFKLGVAHSVHLTVEKLNKLQSAGWIYADETSKITVKANGAKLEGALVFDIAASEGLIFGSAFSSGNASVSYALGKLGSVLYNGGLSTGTHTVKSVTLDCGDASQTGKAVLSRKLIGFTSSSQTFSFTADGVTAQDSAGAAITAAAGTPSLSAAVGTYAFEKKNDGYYVSWVAYGDAAVYARTLAEAAADWSAADAWTVGDAAAEAPQSGSETMLTVNADAALTMNDAASVGALTIAGSGKLTFAADGDSTHTLTASSTAVNTDVDASAGVASLGAVTVAEGKTLTMATQVFTSLAGAGTLVYTAAQAADEWSGYDFPAAFTGALRVTKGNLVFEKTSNQNDNVYPQQASVTLSGADAKMTLKVVDATGWGTPSNQKRLAVEDGATLAVEKRDSFNMPLVLKSGKVTFSADDLDSGRSLDMLGNATVTSSGESEMGGASATEDSETGDRIVNSGKIAIRRSNLPIEVTDGELNVYASLTTAAGFGGALIKRGAGTLTLFREATSALPVSVEEGTLRLTNKGQASASGALTIAENARLEVNTAKETYTQTVTNALSGAGAVEKTGAGTAKLSGNLSGFTGTITLTAGALDVGSATVGETKPTFAFGEGATGTLTVPAGAEGTVTVPAGAALKLVLSAAQVLEGYTASGVTLADGGAFSFVNAAGETITEGVKGTTYTAPLNTWTPAEASEDGTYRWSTAANWSTGTVPAEAESVRISITADTTLTLDAAVTVAGLTVEGAGTLTLTGEKLTVSGQTLARTGLSAASTAFAAGAMDIAEGVQVAYDVKSNQTLVPLTGAGTFVKEGSATLTLKNANACEVPVVVASGTLLFGDETFSGVYDVTTKAGAVIQIGTWAGKLTSSESALRLEGGATLRLVNGNTNAGGAIAAKIYVQNASAETPAVIEGSNYGNASVLSGGITGTGVVCLKSYMGNTFTVSGSITDGTEGALHVKVTAVNGVIFSGANTYTGGTEIAEGAALTCPGMAQLGGSGAAVAVQGTLTFTSSANVNEADMNLSGITGTGTLCYSGSGWRTLPNSAGLRFASTLALKNEQADGLILTDGSAVSAVGTLSGSKAFRADWGTETTRSLKIVQAKDSEYTGELVKANNPDRLAKVVVTGADGASAKTLTLAGATTTTRPLEVDAAGVVNLTGSYAGPVSVSGVFGGSGTLADTLTFADGAVLDASNGMLTVSGAVSAAGALTVLLPEGFAATTEGSKVLAASAAPTLASVAAMQAGETPVADGVLVAKEDGLYVVKPTVAPPSGTETLDDAVTDAVAAAAAEAGVLSVSVAEGSADINGVALFTGLTPVVTPSAEDAAAGTVSVAYAFGISDLRVVELDGAQAVILCAKVQAEKGADFADGTALEVLSGATAGDASAMTAVATARALTAEELTALGLTPGAGERYLYVMPITRDTPPTAFRVRATNAQTAGE